MRSGFRNEASLTVCPVADTSHFHAGIVFHAPSRLAHRLTFVLPTDIDESLSREGAPQQFGVLVSPFAALKTVDDDELRAFPVPQTGNQLFYGSLSMDSSGSIKVMRNASIPLSLRRHPYLNG